MFGIILSFWVYGQPTPLEQTRNLSTSLLQEENLELDLERAAIQGMLRYLDGQLGYGTSSVMNVAQKDAYLEHKQGIRQGYGLQVQLLPRRGFWIDKVFPDASSYKAGIRVGDIIVQIGQQNLMGISANEMVDILYQPPKDKVHFEILRKGVEMQFVWMESTMARG